MEIKITLNKVTAIFSTALMLSSPFQTYAFASNLSKATASAVASKQEQNESKLSKNFDGHASSIESRSLSEATTQASENKVVSDAYNYKDLERNVDSRTGAFTLSYKVSEITGNGFEDPSVSLSMAYSSLTNDNLYGLGKGWSWNLTHYDPQSNMLSVAGSGSYKLDLGKGKLRYYKLNDLFVVLDNSFITLKYKDGKEEVLDRAFGNLRKITNAQGLSVEFNYTQGNRLESIVYPNQLENGEIKKLEILYPSDSTIIIKRNIGTTIWPTTTLTKTTNNFLLSSIKNPLGQEVKFYYNAENESNFSTESLITSVSYPTGTTVNIDYLKGGLESAKKGLSAPAVLKTTTQSLPLSENNKEEIFYSYYDKYQTNYLGRGFSGYKEGEDTLFFTPNSYTYSTVEKKPSPDGTSLFTEREYNHFHQLIKETLKSNSNLLQAKEFTYPDWQNKSFESLDANYNLPKVTKTTFYNGQTSRVEITKQEYDSYGNLIRSEDAFGLIKEYSYLPADKTFNGSVHLLNRTIESSTADTISRITEYAYTAAKNAQNKDFQRLKATIHKYSKNKCTISESNCGIVYKTEINSFENSDILPAKNKVFSLPSFTKVLAASGGKCKIAKKGFNYSKGTNLNTTSTVFLSQQGNPLAKEESSKNSFTNNVEKELVNGIERSFQYDSLDRLTKETVVSNGISPLVTSYSYFLNNSYYGGYGTSTILKQKPNGYSEYNVYDSLGREIKKYSQSLTENSFNLITSYSYNVTGQKKTETLYNIDASNENFNLTLSFQYDALGRQIISTAPSGEKKVTVYNDVENSQESYMLSSKNEKSVTNITYYNIMKKPVRSLLFTPQGNLHSESTSKYDGFGNLIESIDVNNIKTRFVYNPIGQKVEDIFHDGRRIIYDYDLLLEDKIVKKSVIAQDKKENILGVREYNTLGQLISDSDPSGNAISYSYDDRGNLILETLRSGKKIKFTYNGMNNLIAKEVVGDSNDYTSTYKYDSLTQLMSSMTDATGTTLYNYYPNGKLKSVTYPDKKVIAYKYDLQDKTIGITDARNAQTLYYYNHENGRLDKTKFTLPQLSEQIEHYSYDNFGRIDKKILPNNAYSKYTYDNLGNLDKLSHFMPNNSTILSYTYTYYKDMNIASRKRQENGLNTTENYIYDAMNNLEQYLCSGSICPKDQNGNSIVLEKYKFDNLNNIKEATVGFLDGTTSITTYYYAQTDPSRLLNYTVLNSQGQQTSTLEYDLDGNIIKDGEGNKLDYNPFNRLISFTKNNNVTEYKYNGVGALVAQKNSSLNEIKFYYSGNRVISESHNGVLVSYIQVAGRVIGKQAENGNLQFFITDQAHSVIRIIESGTLLSQNYVYTPYGQQSDLSQNIYNTESGIGFNGERTDGKTGYQFLGKGYRAYNPALGRFMQYDIHSPFGKGGINGYTFAENNPIMKFDPTGESAKAIMGVGIGLSIFGILASVFTFGASTGFAVAGFTAMTTTQAVLATTSLATGLAAGATGITSAVYGKYASDAAKSGNKEAAASYAKKASRLGWATLGLGIASAVSGIGANIAGRSVNGYYSMNEAPKNGFRFWSKSSCSPHDAYKNTVSKDYTRLLKRYDSVKIDDTSSSLFNESLKKIKEIPVVYAPRKPPRLQDSYYTWLNDYNAFLNSGRW